MKPSMLFFKFQHAFIKSCQKLVLEKLIINQTELTTGVMIRGLVSSTWKIKPFRVTKLISNKVQVAFPSKTAGYQTNHFVQSHTPVNDRVGWGYAWHVRVHVLVHQPESYGFVSNQSLYSFQLSLKLNCSVLFSNKKL